MTHPDLERLLSRRLLEREESSREEVDHLVASGQRRLQDAAVAALALESRFTLAYDAAHAFALAALREAGYRSRSRYMVFQCLKHTLAVAPRTQLLLVQAHERRNRGQYEGVFDVTDRFVDETLAAARELLVALRVKLSEA